MDLTVPDADRARDFYAEVAGWEVSDVPMGSYSDYCMIPAGESDAVAGICHAQGVNAGLPPIWLIYINVADIEHSVCRCIELGGEVVQPPKTMGAHGTYCVIRDPGGAHAALFQPA